MATSAIPYNRVQLYRSLGIELPAGVASDTDGLDTQDANAAEMLAPLGGAFGFKGAGLAGLVDPKKENERIDRRVKSLDKDIESLEKRLSSEKFVKNAPPDVVAEARAQLEQLKRQRERLLEAKSFVDELEKTEKS